MIENSEKEIIQLKSEHMDIDIKIKKQIKKQESSNQESELISKKRIVGIKKDNFTEKID